MCRSSTRASTRTSSASRARPSCSASACSRRTRASRTSSPRCPRSWPRYPDVVYIVVGATHPHVHPARRRDLPAVAAMAGAGEGRRRPRDLLQPLRQPGGAGRVHRRGRHLHHALPERGRRSRPGTLAYTVGAGKAVISTPVLVRGRDAGRRTGRAGAVPRPGGLGANRSSTCWTTRPSATPCASGPTCSGGR